MNESNIMSGNAYRLEIDNIVGIEWVNDQTAIIELSSESSFVKKIHAIIESQSLLEAILSANEAEFESLKVKIKRANNDGLKGLRSIAKNVSLICDALAKTKE